MNIRKLKRGVEFRELYIALELLLTHHTQNLSN